MFDEIVILNIFKAKSPIFYIYTLMTCRHTFSKEKKARKFIKTYIFRKVPCAWVIFQKEQILFANLFCSIWKFFELDSTPRRRRRTKTKLVLGPLSIARFQKISICSRQRSKLPQNWKQFLRKTMSHFLTYSLA